MKSKLVFATNNKHKLEEVKKVVRNHFDILSLTDIGCHEEIEEPGHTLEENAFIKARYVKEKYGYDCFGDDTGLEVEALNGAPGVYSARYGGGNHDSEANIKKLLNKLNKEENRGARFRTVIALIFEGQEYQFDGIVEGEIIREKRGTAGFGYDPVFVPDGYTQTFAELGNDVKADISHRARATKKLCDFLKDKLVPLPTIYFTMNMNWKQLLSANRFGMEKYHDEREHNRSDFQRDYDRLIFSSPFRRLQNKTQVFPLPGSVFVHNRLTHSIEVSSVGRSLGDIVGRALRKKYKEDSQADFEDISSIIAAGCLAHDLGNPPFGHSGETAITSYFSEGEGKNKTIKKGDKEITLEEAIKLEGGRWEDFINFEGNANSIRLLMHQFNGRRRGGFVMTYSMLASIVKYPYSSIAVDAKGKFGFFQSEEDDYKTIANSLGIICKQENPLQFVRYPLVYLVEAADDICYKIMDIEDAHKLGILSTEKTKSLFMDFFPQTEQENQKRVMNNVQDVNEQIAYLRSIAIGLLVNECAKVFVDNEEAILAGEFDTTLIKEISPLPNKAYKEATKVSVAMIYKSRDVVDIELAGHRIIGFLIDKFITAILNPDANYSKLLISRIPDQYEIGSESLYTRILAVLDFVSGMTDVYALDLYRKITGMSLPTV